MNQKRNGQTLLTCSGAQLTETMQNSVTIVAGPVGVTYSGTWILDHLGRPISAFTDFPLTVI